MNIDLSRIIRESINDLICDDIINEAIDNVVLLAEARDDTKRARYERELRKKGKYIPKSERTDPNVKREPVEKRKVPHKKNRNKNKNLTPTGPVKTDDVKELDKDSSVKDVDPKVGAVNPATPGNSEGKGSELPVNPIQVDNGNTQVDNGNTQVDNGNTQADGEGTQADGEKPVDGGAGTPGDGEEDQNKEAQEAAKQLLEKYDFKKYSDKLRQLIGNGIDPQPVADDKNAVQFVQQFNQFLFAVINAIESGNLLRNPSTGGNGKSGSQLNPYAKSKYDGFYDALTGLLDQGAMAFDQAVGKTDLTNAVFGGMGAAFNKNYHQVLNAANNFINNRAYLQSMANNNAAAAGGNAKQGLSLSDLMLPNGCQYIIMLGSYQNVNSSSNNKLTTIAVIPQAFQVLEALREELYRFQQEAQQTAQKLAQQNGGNQGEEGQQEETPENKTPLLPENQRMYYHSMIERLKSMSDLKDDGSNYIISEMQRRKDFFNAYGNEEDKDAALALEVLNRVLLDMVETGENPNAKQINNWEGSLRYSQNMMPEGRNRPQIRNIYNLMSEITGGMKNNAFATEGNKTFDKNLKKEIKILNEDLKYFNKVSKWYNKVEENAGKDSYENPDLGNFYSFITHIGYLIRFLPRFLEVMIKFYNDGRGDLLKYKYERDYFINNIYEIIYEPLEEYATEDVIDMVAESKKYKKVLDVYKAVKLTTQNIYNKINEYNNNSAE